MGVEVGHQFKAAIKKNTNGWGPKAIQLGAGDGFEFNSESLASSVAMIMNEGITGRAFRRRGSAGNLTPGGDVDLDFYYRCAGHRFLAAVMGADAVTALGGTAQRHDLSLLSNQNSVWTLAFAGAEGVKESPSAMVTGFKVRWDESTQRGKIMPTLVGFDHNENVGSPDDDFAVVSVAAANGPLTITAAALADFWPSPLTFTKVVGITAITVTIVAIDRFGNQYTKVITQTDFVSEVWTDTEYVKRVVSMTISGLTGTGNVKAGVSNGINNASTVSAITTSADRDCSLFSQMEVLVNAQGDIALAAAYEQFVSAIEVGVELSVDSRVTTRYGNRIEQPTVGGASRPQVTVGMNFSAFTDQNRRFLMDQIGKNPLKMKVTLTGPQIATSGFAHSITLWLNEIQFEEGDRTIGGSSVVPFDLSGQAYDALAVPTGFPAGADEPLFMQIQNAESAAYI